MISDDFYGKKFVWFIGQIEDRDDPLKLGRVRVRIFGLHSQNKSELSDSSLPWCQVLLPNGGSKVNFSPSLGEMVYGFFQDGESGQIPVVTGLFAKVQPIKSPEPPVPEEKNPPKPPENVVIKKEGEPTTSRLSRGVLDGTLIKQANEFLSKGCSSLPQVQTATAWVRQQFGIVAQEIRKAITAAIKSLGLSDKTGIYSSVISWLKSQLAEVKRIMKMVNDEILFVMNKIKEVVSMIREFVNFVLQLPAKIISFLVGCMQAMLKAMSDGLSNMLNLKELTDSGVSKDLQEMLSSVKEISSMGISTIQNIASVPSQAMNLVNSLNIDTTKISTSFTGSLNNGISSVQTQINSGISALQTQLPNTITPEFVSAITSNTSNVTIFTETIVKHIEDNTPNTEIILKENTYDPKEYPMP